MILKNIFVTSNGRARAVCNFDPVTFNLITHYDSAADAERATGINRAAIGDVCKGYKQTAGEFIWEYLCNIENPLHNMQNLENEK